MSTSATAHESHGLKWLVAQLDSINGSVDAATAETLFARASLALAEIAPYIEYKTGSYARRCVVRRDNYELLVLTWAPGQGSVPHDHSGSLCALRIVQGTLVEKVYESGVDGQVRPSIATTFSAGQVIIDPGLIIHSLSNQSSLGEELVTVHLYSPPLAEIRRSALASEPPAEVFGRAAAPNARVIAIIGGGFTGTMTLANILRHHKEQAELLHVVLIDRQPAVGEGVAYRTNDPRHLLNVPAGKMSAWPDIPDDFLNFARRSDPSVCAGDFLPRKLYGNYIRDAFYSFSRSAPGNLSIELIRDDATGLFPGEGNSDWLINTARGRTVRADFTVITLGHRPPAEEFVRRWSGPRTRFVADPWSALVLSQIGADEPVLILGSGLSAVDAILAIDRPDRTAPITVVSRRGFMPQPHAREPKNPADVSALVARWLDPSIPLKARKMLAALREAVSRASENGVDWRQVIDGLRPSTAKIWKHLDSAERARFFRHLRPFWEVHRHRMAPAVANQISELRSRGILKLTCGVLVAARADFEGIDVTLSRRDGLSARQIRVSWVLNCTGPGVHSRRSTHPILRPLIENGALSDDPLGLGLLTDNDGRALKSNGEAHPNLLIAGTLRKSTLWESTAIPELRQQAADAAFIALHSVAPGKSS